MADPIDLALRAAKSGTLFHFNPTGVALVQSHLVSNIAPVWLKGHGWF
jgi:hypothetical protein